MKTLKTLSVVSALLALVACSKTSTTVKASAGAEEFPTVAVSASPQNVTSNDTFVILNTAISNKSVVSKVEFYHNTGTTSTLISAVTSPPYAVVIPFSVADRQNDNLRGVRNYTAKVYTTFGTVISKQGTYNIGFCMPNWAIPLAVPTITASSTPSVLNAAGKVTLKADTQLTYNVKFYRVQGTKETLLSTDCIEPYEHTFAFSKPAQNGTYSYKLVADGAGGASSNTSYTVAIP